MPFKKIMLAGLQFAVAILSLGAAAPSAFAQAKWEKLAPFPEPAEEILGSAAGGKMYVFAGFIPIWKPKGLVYEYDPATDHWTKKKPMALPSHHVAWNDGPDWDINPHFVGQVKKVTQSMDRPVVLICRSGQRSDSAARAAAAAGYGMAFNVLEGFEGAKDADGHRSTLGGWRKAGLPWVQG